MERHVIRLIVAAAVFGASGLQAATYTTPRQLALDDVYQLNPDGYTGEEETTQPKADLNDGQNGDNIYYRRTNVVRAYGYPCTYWYTSSYQNPDEPDPNGPQYVDYTPPFGPAANQLRPGRYRLNNQYRYTDSRADYPAEYIVTHAGGTVVVPRSQREGASGSCVAFDIGEFDLDANSTVRVNDPGGGSICFGRMLYTYLGPSGGVPYVSAGPDQTIVLPATAALDGTVADADGQPGPLTVTWSQVSGPGTVTFGDAAAVDTTASFSVDGTYVLRLTATDTLNSVSDEITVTVLPLGSCGLNVTPGCGTARQSSTVAVFRNYLMGYAEYPVPLVEFVLTNVAATPITYTVTEANSAAGAGADFAWLTINNPTGVIPGQGSVTVTATITGNGLGLPDAADADGAFTNYAYLAFSEGSCALPVITRRICVTAIREDAASVHIYQGNVAPTDPDSAGPAGSGYNFAVQEGVNQGFVENDPQAVDGLAWRIPDALGAKTKYRAARASPLMDPLVYTRSGATVVARVKVRSHTDPRGGALVLWDGHLAAEYHWGDNLSDGVITELNRGSTTILPGRFDQNYHILRMTAIGDADCNRIIHLYFDEDVSPVAVLTIPNATQVTSAGSVDGLGFGAGSTAGAYDIAFDWVSLTNTGAFAPGQEQAVIGRSLIVGRNCAMPAVDSDADQDVDMDDFAAMQRCFNGMMQPWVPLGPGCECFDNADPRSIIDEFDINFFTKCATGPDVAWAPTVDCPN